MPIFQASLVTDFANAAVDLTSNLTGIRNGEQLDHYRIEALAARSGMASIFRATDVRTGQLVAIKIPHPELEGDPVLYDRFKREQEIGQKLDHPGVIKVFPDTDHSQLYMVMEWVEGPLLRHIMNEHRKLSADRAVRLALRIAEALEYIHAHGIAHRDLKPENIMVDAEDRIKLIDFGIASRTGSRRLTFSKLSPSLGTPDYISPEQVRGKRGNARSDLYALGIMLYEMLTGTVPFTGTNAFVIMNDRLVNSPVPPREVEPAISPQLQEIIYRAIEREPAKRYPDAHQFIWDLQHQDQVGVAERSELRDWRKRRKPVSRAILWYIMLALLPVAIFGILLWAARH